MSISDGDGPISSGSMIMVAVATYLADQQRDAAFHELAHSPGICIKVAAGEALVGRVEEDVVSALRDNIRNLRPLLARRVDTRGIVCTRVDEEDGAWFCGLEESEVFVERKSNGGRIVVGVCFKLNTDAAEDLEVVDCGNWMSSWDRMQARQRLPHVGSLTYATLGPSFQR